MTSMTLYQIGERYQVGDHKIKDTLLFINVTNILIEDVDTVLTECIKNTKLGKMVIF